MKGKTVNRSLPPPVQCREGFFIPLQYPRQELLVALAHLVLLGRLRAASVMNFVVDREKFQKKRRTRRAVSYPPRGRIWFWTMCGSCPFSWGKQCIRMGDRDDETCRLSTCDGAGMRRSGGSGAGVASDRHSSLRPVPNPGCADRSQPAGCRGQRCYHLQINWDLVERLCSAVARGFGITRHSTNRHDESRTRVYPVSHALDAYWNDREAVARPLRCHRWVFGTKHEWPRGTGPAKLNRSEFLAAE